MAFSGFNKAGDAAPMAEINMIPLIDVMLVLLVIFIVPGALAATLAAVQPAALHAQEPKPETSLSELKVESGREIEGYNPPTASSATEIEAPLRDIPQTVNVIPQELIRDQAVRSMQEALRNVRGIGLASGDGQRYQVSIRGVFGDLRSVHRWFA